MRLWKAAVELEDPHDARILLSRCATPFPPPPSPQCCQLADCSAAYLKNGRKRNNILFPGTYAQIIKSFISPNAFNSQIQQGAGLSSRRPNFSAGLTGKFCQELATLPPPPSVVNWPIVRPHTSKRAEKEIIYFSQARRHR